MSNSPSSNQIPSSDQMMALIVEFKPDKPPTIPLQIVALPVSPLLPLNNLVDQIEYFYSQQAIKYGELEEMQVIYLENKTTKTTQFNYNMPVKNYFSNGDTVLVHAEIARTSGAPPDMLDEEEKLPVTVITGFLGSGKTTLLNRILKEKHGKRIMVIQNEFGSIEIDGTLAEDAMFSKEDIQVLDNGCACCTVRGDLGKAFVEILDKSQESDIDIEHIIVETTGLANPAPIIQTFYQEQNVAMSLKLDGILTVIDAKNVLKHIDEVPEEGKVNECVEQVSFADRILLNKMDLVTGSEARVVKDKIRSINQFAKIIPTTQSQVDLGKILNIRAFSLERLLEKDADFLDRDESESEHTCDESDCSHNEEGPNHEHNHDHDHENNIKVSHKHDVHDHESHHNHKKKEDHESVTTHEPEADHKHGVSHDKQKKHKHKHHHKHKHKHKKKKKEKTQTLQHSSGVSSIGFEREGEVAKDLFEMFMSNVISKWGANIYRAKGIINISGNPNKLVFHGVHELFDTNNETLWGPDDKRTNKLVFIGKDLKKEILEMGFGCCLKSNTNDEELKTVKRSLQTKDSTSQVKKPRMEVSGATSKMT